MNSRSDIYNECQYGAYIAYGIDKKWHGLMFNSAKELEDFKKSRNFIYILDCKQLEVRLRTRNAKENASKYAEAANKMLYLKYGAENDKNIPESAMKTISQKISDDYVHNNPLSPSFEAGILRKKYLENYLKGNGKVRLYASLDIYGNVDVNMPNFTTAKDYFKNNPDKLLELILEQNALKVDKHSYKITES